MNDDVGDRELLRRLRAGAPGAFEEFVIAHQHRVFSVAYRMLGTRAEAEDVAQETFLRAHRALGGFRGDSRLSTWLYAIGARLCFDHLAARRRRPAVSADEDRDIAESTPAEEAGPGDEAERGELRAAVLRAIDELPDDR
ncbi:MAG: sigma-70 family RNA polymerase sigma factor, partial [Candidatus Rokubacteria bacterium]|nr:sigma-70 family RNA polymerase sigma factor [Candidatus Rokubacteria bacterium]